MTPQHLRHALWSAPRAITLAGVAFFDVLADGGLRYAARVLTHGDSSPSDIEWRPQSRVQPSPTPNPWPIRSECAALGKLPTSGAQSLVVVHDGQIVCEWYANGGRVDRPAAAFSVSKTIVSLLLARAVAENSISGLDLPITAGVPELRERDPRFDQITLADLVDMRSGIAFSEDMSFPWVNRDYPNVYYATDLASVVINRPVIEAPPGQFTYNDYAPNLVGLAVQRMTGVRLTEGPFQQLWNDIGAQYPATWATDDQGFPHHESGVAVTARDLARIGQLMIDAGRIAGRHVAPQAFLERSLDPAGTVPVTSFYDISVGYSNGWWHLRRPTGGSDLAAMGAHGQVMLVSPATRTVIVRMGDDYPQLPNIDIALRLQRLADEWNHSVEPENSPK